jgi:hypothetical protein
VGGAALFGSFRQILSSPCDALLKANPWLGDDSKSLLRTFALPTAAPPRELVAARRAATLERLTCGEAVWDGWAEAMRALAVPLADEPAAQRLWEFAATTEMADAAILAVHHDLAGLTFPGAVDFSNAGFVDAAWFSAATFHGEASFRDTRFERGANFENATFHGAANFDGASFGRSGEFRQVRFLGPASFRRAEFVKDAWFRGGAFAALDMEGASFGGEAGLGNVRYGGPVNFSTVTFGDNAGFEAAAFEDVARFDDARFARNARFEKSQFRREPSFGRARFLGKFLFDGIEVPQGTSPVHQTIADLARRLG